MIDSFSYTQPITIRVKGDVPEYTSYGDAGADLRAAEDFFVEAKSRRFVPTDTIVEIPLGTVGLVCSRSGLAKNHGICVLNAPGVIDSGFRSTLGAVLYNSSNVDFRGKKGDRVAQLLIVPVFHASFIQSDELSQSERGENGFGSSGNA